MPSTLIRSVFFMRCDWLGWHFELVDLQKNAITLVIVFCAVCAFFLTGYPSWSDNLNSNRLHLSWHALWKHKGKALAVFVLVMAAVVAGVLVVPLKYESDAKLFIRLGRESVGVDPTAYT